MGLKSLLRRAQPPFRVAAILATHNEERFIGVCLEHLIQQGCHVYLCDNESTDQTVAIAKSYLGRGLIGLETLPRKGMVQLRGILERKEELAAALDADWFMHVDADEIRLPPSSDVTLAQALYQADSEGYNAVNFLEFSFVPTRQAPDHDHADYIRTMRWYYPFLPRFPHRLNAWKRQSSRVNLADGAGHQVKFPGLRMYPRAFRMRHYVCLSETQAVRKYVERVYDPNAVKAGWHVRRARLTREDIRLPDAQQLRTYISDDDLDASEPCKQHFWDWS